MGKSSLEPRRARRLRGLDRNSAPRRVDPLELDPEKVRALDVRDIVGEGAHEISFLGRHRPSAWPGLSRKPTAPGGRLFDRPRALVAGEAEWLAEVESFSQLTWVLQMDGVSGLRVQGVVFVTRRSDDRHKTTHAVL
jgi:hypothetical protein